MEGQGKHAKNIPSDETIVCQGTEGQRGGEAGARFDLMGNGGRTALESQRGSEFSMKSANDKIRARPFRHTKFQNVSAWLRSSYSGRVPPFPAAAASSRAEHEATVERRSRDISIILKLAVFNFHERFRIADAFEEKNSRERDDCRLPRTAQEW